MQQQLASYLIPVPSYPIPSHPIPSVQAGRHDMLYAPRPPRRPSIQPSHHPMAQKTHPHTSTPRMQCNSAVHSAIQSS
ncbi:uncharacterized protein K452DRAFT_171827 [Aplosporella prunicola CBS 121167]|uniref:Uncharacterized protein n=1 Tax=Aplosporella prunicola CBS 121167 TaxID=1176127 RepID=A0A6A6BIM6_9PEZI|nr:uncharacterized protein K452DRAFT_171827 [Aplosporella prunicola CBS 121167]KAF2143488.1 hypothetical protein K452DRAFT_171827 [Aplosporella prunicola CBS 121167]